MSDLKELVIKLRADPSGYDSGTKKAKQDNEDLKKSSSGLGDGFVKGAGAALGFIGTAAGIASVSQGLGMVKDYMTGAIQGAMDMQVAQENTNRILSSGSHITGLTAQAVDSLSTKMSNQTGVDDDVVRGAENIIAGYQTIASKSFPAVTQAALDMARAQSNATGAAFDANAAAKALGDAMQDPAKGARLLKQYIGALTPAEQDAINTATKHGDTMKAQSLLLQDVQKRVKGTSDAYKDTAAGGIQSFNTSLGNIQKSLGAAILPLLTNLLNKVAPIAASFADKLPGAIKSAQAAFSHLQPSLDWINQHGDFIKTAIVGLGIGIAVALVPSLIAWAAGAWAAALPTIALMAPIIGVALVIGALVTGIILLVQHWGAISAFFGNVAGAIGKFFGNLFGAIGSFVGNALGAIGRFIGGAVAFFASLPGKVWGFITSLATGLLLRVGQLEIAGLQKVGDFIGGIVGFFKSLPGAVVALLLMLKAQAVAKFVEMKAGFENALNGIKQSASNIWNSVVGVIKGAINTIIGDINGFINTLNKLSIHIPSISVGPVSTPAFNWNGPGIPHIPYLAAGGIATRPTLAVVGDAGPEAIIPLSRMGKNGMGGNTYTITINGADHDSAMQLAREVQAQIRRKELLTGLRSA